MKWRFGQYKYKMVPIWKTNITTGWLFYHWTLIISKSLNVFEKKKKCSWLLVVEKQNER